MEASQKFMEWYPTLMSLRARVSPLFLSVLLLFPAASFASGWPEFRGPSGDGVAPEAFQLPEKISPDSTSWRTELPGKGWSSPVSDGSVIWLTAAVETLFTAEEEAAFKKEAGLDDRKASRRKAISSTSLLALQLDPNTGAILKQVNLGKIDSPQIIHNLNSYASPTPAIADGLVVCHFGAFGTFCLDAASGDIKWKREFVVEHGVGPGSSPFIASGRVFILSDGTDAQYVTAVDLKTGETLWQTDRPPMPLDDPDRQKSYNTPILVKGHDNREQLICMGAQWLVSYHPETGEEWWRYHHGEGFSVVPRPLFSVENQLLYILTGFGKPHLLAMPVTGSGDITDEEGAVAWRETKRMPQKPSAVLHEDTLFLIADGGVATAVDGRDGSVYWTERVSGNYSASPLLADGRILFLNQEGGVKVISADRDFSGILFESNFDESFMASPMVLHGRLFLRSEAALYAFPRAE